MLVVATAIFPGLCSLSAPEDFRDFRVKAAALEPESDADYALGRELLAEMRRVALTKPVIGGRKLFYTQCVPYRFMRLYFAEKNWFDHALFDNRLLFGDTPHQYQVKSGLVNCKLLELSGLDGLGTWCYHARNFAVFDDLMVQYRRSGGAPLANAITLSARTAWYGSLNHEALKYAVNSESCLKLDGKPAIFTYAMDKLSPSEEFKFVQEIRDAVGGEVVFLHEVGSLQGGMKSDPYHFYCTHGCVPATYALAYYDKLTEYLAVGDGLDFWNRLTRADRSFYYEYYDEFVLPMFLAACAQPHFLGKKYYMQQLQVGYNGYAGSQTMSRDGTKTLRGYLELCRKYPVDFILGAEWDENNEDTSLQPTVLKPMSSLRILRYYTALFKGEKPTPLANDDFTLPNLIISHPYQFLLGRDFEVELLNVPDGGPSLPYTVALELVDEHGMLVHGPVTLAFPAGELTEHTIRVPSAELCRVRALRPRLTITRDGLTKSIFGGLPPAIIRTTECSLYSWVSTPLRNLLHPSQETVNFQSEETLPGKASTLRANAEVTFPGHPLNTFEVVANGVDVAAFDPRNEFLTNSPDRRLFTFHACFLGKGENAKQRLSFRYQVRGASGAVLFEGEPTRYGVFNYSLPFRQIPFNEPLERKMIAGWHGVPHQFSVPLADLEKAVFVISGKRVEGPRDGEEFQWECPLGKLGEKGVFAKNLVDGLQFALESQGRLARQTLPLEREDVQYACRLPMEDPETVVAFRAVSLDGRVWWSRPFALGRDSGQDCEIAMHDEKAGRRVLRVDASRVPVLRYCFDPEASGDILSANYGREFNVTLGNFSMAATGLRGMMGFKHNVPCFAYATSVPNGNGGPAPLWEKLPEGGYALRFPADANSFLNIPPSAIPQRAAFSMEFDVWPEDVERDQVWLSEQGAQSYLCGFCLRTEAGRFVIDFMRAREEKETENDKRKTHRFSFGPKEGCWNRIRLSYDGGKCTLGLGDLQETWAVSGMSVWNVHAGFGGNASPANAGGRPRHFQGRLKSLSISHRLD